MDYNTNYNADYNTKENGILTFKDCPYEYVLTGELGRGSSSIVYDGYYVNNSGARRPVRIREMQYKTEEERRHLRCTFDLNNSLFDTDGLTNRIVNTYEIYEKDNKIYIVTTYQEGMTLDKCRFESVQDAIGIVRSIARTLKLLHDRGYLYLDVKPENVLVLDGTRDWVQLYDFDSVIRKKDIEECSVTGGSCAENNILRFTSKWASYELRRGDIEHVGTWSDVYGVGAVLFYLLFGRVPDVFDCDENTVYDVGKLMYRSTVDSSCPANNKKHFYRDSFAMELAECLHRTLSRNWSDRYQSMDELLMILDSLYGNSDETRAYVVSSPVACIENVVGRTDELKLLTDWFSEKTKPCIFVTGMGGIGKSTLVRRFVIDVRDRLDTVLYLNYSNSFYSTVCNDDMFYINTVCRQADENEADYFHRKLRKFRECISENTKESLVVVDNVPVLDNSDIYMDDGISELVRTGCRLIVVTRGGIIPECYDHIHIEAFSVRRHMYELMLSNMRNTESKSDADLYEKLDELIDRVNGHTLMLMILARQIDRGYLSIDEACALVRKQGFTALDGVKTGCTIDSRNVYGHMTDMISSLFCMDGLTPKQRGILMSLALFGDSGVDFRDFSCLIDAEDENMINELADIGWVERHKKLALHPVIGQAVRRELGRKWEDIQDKKNMPQETEELQPVKACLANLIAGDNVVASICVAVANCCMNVDNLCDSREYLRLAAKTIVMLPIESEQFILTHGRRIWEMVRHTDELISDREMVEVCDKLAHIYAEMGRYSDTEEILGYLEKWSEGKSHYIEGFVCDIRIDYLDTILDGNFEPETGEGKKMYALQMRYMDRAIACYEKAETTDALLKLAADIIAVATYTVRSCFDGNFTLRSRKKVVDLLNRARMIMTQIDNSETGGIADNAENWLSYYITKGWFYTYIDVNPCQVDRNIHKAWKVYSRTCSSELDLINYMLIPAANIYIELGDRNECIVWLERAVKLCERNSDLDAYNRKWEELEQIIREL